MRFALPAVLIALVLVPAATAGPPQLDEAVLVAQARPVTVGLLVPQDGAVSLYAYVEQGAYDEFTISHVASGGTFLNDDETMVSFRPAVQEKYYAEVVRAAAQSIPSASLTQVDFDTTTQNRGFTIATPPGTAPPRPRPFP